jgi:hypothetical protein
MSKRGNSDINDEFRVLKNTIARAVALLNNFCDKHPEFDSGPDDEHAPEFDAQRDAELDVPPLIEIDKESGMPLRGPGDKTPPETPSKSATPAAAATPAANQKPKRLKFEPDPQLPVRFNFGPVPMTPMTVFPISVGATKVAPSLADGVSSDNSPSPPDSPIQRTRSVFVQGSSEGSPIKRTKTA